MTRVSIVIPVYNGEPYLEGCIRSVMAQTIRDIEIIVVNDGSKDGSSEIAHGLAAEDPRVQVIDQKNQGLSGARNVGMDMAQGEFIGFVDCDDWVDTDMYETLYVQAKKLKAQWCVGGLVYERGASVSYGQTPPFEGDLLERPRIESEFLPAVMGGRSLLNGKVFMATAWVSIYENAHLRKTGIRFFEGVRNEDTLFALYLAETCSRIAISTACKYHYRKNAGSMTEKYYTKLREMVSAGDPYYDAFYRRNPWIAEAYLDRKFVSMSTEFKNVVSIGNPFVSLWSKSREIQRLIATKWQTELLDQNSYRPKRRYQKLVVGLARNKCHLLVVLCYWLRGRVNKETVSD